MFTKLSKLCNIIFKCSFVFAKFLNNRPKCQTKKTSITIFTIIINKCAIVGYTKLQVFTNFIITGY